MMIGAASGFYPNYSDYRTPFSPQSRMSAGQIAPLSGGEQTTINPLTGEEEKSANPDEIKKPDDAPLPRNVKPARNANIRTVLTKEMFLSKMHPIFHRNRLEQKFVRTKENTYPMLTKKRRRTTAKY